MKENSSYWAVLTNLESGGSFPVQIDTVGGFFAAKTGQGSVVIASGVKTEVRESMEEIAGLFAKPISIQFLSTLLRTWKSTRQGAA
jgi:hypothetical protein